MAEQKIERVSKSWTIRKDLVDRLEIEAENRVIGERLLVEKALESYLDALAPLDLPEVKAAVANAPTPRSAVE